MSIDEMMRSISLNISYYRKQNKLSQRQLADLIGLSYSHMSHIEAPNMPISWLHPKTPYIISIQTGKTIRWAS